MVRPLKCRRVGFAPEVGCFKPAGIPFSCLDEVSLTMDEFEAIRLADLLGLYHEDAAKEMSVSRQTFGNIVNSARKKIADSIVNTKVLKLEGGVFIMKGKRVFECEECNCEWKIPYGTGRPQKCPECGCKNIHRASHDKGFARHSHPHERGRCGRSLS